MSVKFERDTYKQTEGVAGVAGAAASAVADARDQLLGRDGPIPGTSGKHPIREAIGTAITGGKQNAGTKGYLAVRLLRRWDPRHRVPRSPSLLVLERTRGQKIKQCMLLSSRLFR